MKWVYTKEGFYLLFPLLGVLDIGTNVLDYFLFTSNLELLLVNSVILLGIYFLFIHALGHFLISKKILIALYGSLLVFATSLFCWDIPESNPEFYSDYGFLNTIEYIQFELTVSVVGLIVFSIVSVKIFHIDDIPLSIYFILFGVLIYYISDLVEFGLGTYFLENTQIHSDFLDVFIPVRFYTSKIFILLGLVWKN
jgi:hypothetical protein